MELYSGYMNRLIDELAALPGVGSKSAARLAFYLVHQPEVNVKRLANSIVEAREKKIETRRKIIERQKEEMRKINELEKDGMIDFAELPVLEPGIREILLKWISDALESADFSARTDDGRTYKLYKSDSETCVVHCEDGNFTMPRMRLVFDENV